MEREEKKAKAWEQTIPVETQTVERTYRCPVCNAYLFSVPYSWAVPKEKTEMVCPNGHRVRVPKYPKLK